MSGIAEFIDYLLYIRQSTALEIFLIKKYENNLPVKNVYVNLQRQNNGVP
jgi:hypothetical protein